MSPRPPLGSRGPCQKEHADLRANAAEDRVHSILRSAAAAAPRPTNSMRSSLSRAFSRSAVMAHRRRNNHAKAPRASRGPIARMSRQCLSAPLVAQTLSSLSTSGEASPHAPKTRPLTGSYVRSWASTGPTDPGGVLQKRWSSLRALVAYSAGRARARRATASHRCSVSL